MPSTPRQTFRVDEVIWKKFIKKCEQAGYSASDVLRAFITGVVTGKTPVKSVNPAKAPRGENLQDYYSALEKWLQSHSERP